MAALARVRPRALQLVGLILILVGATLFRLTDLQSRGLVYWDEAKFALEGIRIHAELQSLLGHHALTPVGKAVGTAKPSHALLIALVYAVVGVHDYSPLYLNALSSVVEVGLVYMLGRRLFSPPAGLIAAGLLAVMTYDVVYARSGLSETDGNAVLLGGLAIWTYGRCAPPGTWKSRISRSAVVLAAGLLLGIAFTINYRLVMYIGVIVAVDLLWSSAVDWRAMILRLPSWLVGLCLAPGLWVIVDAIVTREGTALFRSEVTLKPQSYVEQVMGRFDLALGATPSLNTFHWNVLIERVGPPVIVLLLLSIVLAARIRSGPWIMLALLVVVPYIAAMSAPFVVARSLAAAIPFAVLLAAATLVVLMHYARATNVVALLALGTAVAVGTTMSWPLVGERSGFARAAGYLHAHGAVWALTSSEVMAFYLRGPGARCRAPRPSTVDRLAADIRAGYRYAVLDYHARGYMERILRDHGRLVARYPTVTGGALAAGLVAAEDAEYATGTRSRRVDLYRIDMIRPAQLIPAPPDICVLDRPG